MCDCSCDVHLSEIVRLFVFIQVQQENLQQAEELAAQATQIAAVKTDLQDTQKLLSALQSMSTALGHNCQLHQSQNLDASCRACLAGSAHRAIAELFSPDGTSCCFAGVSAKQFEVVIKVLKQQQKPKLQPAQAPLQPFDVIPPQHVSLHSPHQAFKATCTSHQQESDR